MRRQIRSSTPKRHGPTGSNRTEHFAATTDRVLESPAQRVERKFRALFNVLDQGRFELLSEVYDEKIVFEDPIHHIEGIDALRDYFERLYENVESCTFEFAPALVRNDGIALEWAMHLRHRRLRPGEPLSLSGASFIKFQNGRITHHRDHFDVGALIYERIPLLGRIVRLIKARV